MQFMTKPQHLFIRCEPNWSFRYIGGIKDFVDIDFKVMERFYKVACYYVTLRHNFITGHVDSTSYSQQLEQLKTTTTDNYELWSYVLWESESLYRQLRPFLSEHAVPIEKTHFLNDDRGEIMGLIVYLRQTTDVPQMKHI